MGIQFSSQTTSKTRHNWSRQDLGQHSNFYRIGSHNIYETHFHKSNSLRTAAFFLSCIFFWWILFLWNNDEIHEWHFFKWCMIYNFYGHLEMKYTYIQLFYDLPQKSNVANFVGLIAYMQTHILYTPILHLSSVASVGIIIILIIDMILPILAKDFFVIIFIKRNINSFWK